MSPRLLTVLAASLLFAQAAAADSLACVTTTWKMIGANHRVCVDTFSDPKLGGVVCHVAQARTGGITGSLGVAEDPSQFSLSCQQVGAIDMPENLPREETVFSEGTSLLFKTTKVVRIWDETNKILVYLAISRKLIDGAPFNAMSTVPVNSWGGR